MSQVSRLFSFAAAVLIGTAGPSVLSAQVTRLAAVGDTTAVAWAVASDTAFVRRESAGDGPRLTRAAFVPDAASRAAAAPLQGTSGSRGLGAGSNVAMMGVGAAAIVVGSMVGGDGGTMIAVGGGVVGLIGLFRYLR